jgi:hypothetical protein
LDPVEVILPRGELPPEGSDSKTKARSPGVAAKYENDLSPLSIKSEYKNVQNLAAYGEAPVEINLSQNARPAS